jgi:MinD superfamily P-loop ATPase
MKEVVVLSGKGGTGKTSLTAAFAEMVTGLVLVDCDVDAANLHLLMNPEIQEQHGFAAGLKARIDRSLCSGCALCADACRFGAIQMEGGASVNPLRCEGCGVCQLVCPAGAVMLESHVSGEWYVSRTHAGRMVHARLHAGEENSGKLVSILRSSARAVAEQDEAEWILLDGPPGTGCPVISSLTGADYALLVTEPSLSGFEDLRRVAALARHFGIPSGILVNKADINPTVAQRIEDFAKTAGFDFLGRVGYDPAFNRAQLERTSVFAGASEGLRRTLGSAWTTVQRAIQRPIPDFAAVQR